MVGQKRFNNINLSAQIACRGSQLYLFIYLKAGYNLTSLKHNNKNYKL